MNKRLLSLFAAFFSLTTALPAMAGSTFHFQGTIGDHLAINLQLTESDGDKFAGSYRYANHGQQLELQQVSSNEDEYVFKETGWRDDKTTGYLRGKFADDRAAFVGSWQSADKMKSLPLNLRKVAESVELIAARSDRYDVRVDYPKFAGDSAFHAALNDEVRKHAEARFDQTVAEYRANTAKPDDAGPVPYTLTSTVEIVQATDKFVSILYEDYFYTGGAHGNTGYAAENYIFRDGKLVRLSFAQLAGGRPETAAKINALCVKRLKEQKASSPDVKFDPKNDPVVNVTPAGLLFSFGPYEAGSYAEGSFCVLVKFSEFGEQISATSLEK